MAGHRLASLDVRKSLILPVVVLLVASTASARGIIYAGPAWAAIDRSGACEALSRSLRIAAKGKVQAIAGFSFSPDHRLWGQFHARLRRMPRAGAAVMLHIDDQPFLLVSQGNWAWSDGPRQEQAIVEALRSATGMSVQIAQFGRTAVHRPLLARWSSDGNRRGRCGLRWQKPAAITR